MSFNGGNFKSRERGGKGVNGLRLSGLFSKLVNSKLEVVRVFDRCS